MRTVQCKIWWNILAHKYAEVVGDLVGDEDDSYTSPVETPQASPALEVLEHNTEDNTNGPL